MKKNHLIALFWRKANRHAQIAFACSLALFGVGCGKVPMEQQSQPYLQAAFEFASAIPDEKDVLYYQEQVVRRMLGVGALKEAEEMAERMAGWRRGVIFSDIAGQYFSNGDRVNGKKFIERAEEEKEKAEDWERARIAAYMARAWAKTGDIDKIREIGNALETGEDKWLAFLAYLEAEVRQGGLDSALKLADENFSNDKFFDHRFMQPTALINILGESTLNLTEDQRVQVFDLCLKALEKAPPSHAHAIHEELIGVCHRKHWQEQVEVLAAQIRKKFIPEEAWERPEAYFSFKAYQAQFEAMAGHHEEALRILGILRSKVDQSSGLGFERCALMGVMIRAHWLAGDDAGARKLLEHGMATAYREANPRPRAMAYTELLMRAGEAGLVMTREERIRLVKDMNRPWVVLHPDGKAPQG